MFVQLAGRLIALLPEGVVQGICYCLGLILSLTPRGARVRWNRRMALGHKAAPKVPECCARTVELGMLALAGQFFSKERWQKMIAVSPETLKKMQTLGAQPRGVMLLIPHTTLMEALTALPLLVEQPKRISVLYRAFGSPALERMVLGRREQHGVKLLNRSTGMRALIQEIREGQAGGLLFDQSSGEKGFLISFMGRIASASNLPDVVYRHARPIPFILALKRTGFWRGEIVFEELKEPPEDSDALTLQAHRWLENYLQTPATSTDWLWTHRRWKVLDRPREILGLGGREVLELPAQKKTRLLVRMPNWLGDIVMALPALRALRASRPEAEITFLAKSAYLPLLNRLGIADRCLGLPKKPFKSFAFCLSLKNDLPDATIALTNSLRGDIEMRLTGAKIRLGIKREGYPRPLLTQGYRISQEHLVSTHQSIVTEEFLKYFGLKAPLSYKPFQLFHRASSGPIGFVPASSNMPEKRYPAEKWRLLAQKLSCPITLFGAPTEQSITSAIAQGLCFVTDLAGKTDTASLAEELAKCSVVIGNDTGAMHLANAVGVPTIVLYGPTFPSRTHPIFTAPYEKVQSPEGEPIGSIGVEEVLRRLQTMGYL